MKRADISDEAVCAAYQEAKRRPAPIFADGVLADQYPDHPQKVIYSAMERAHLHGLIDYGVSLRAGWLTDKGLALTSCPLQTGPNR